ncbi:DUF262 domain-containing protein [Enterobacter hormaechei]
MSNLEEIISLKRNSLKTDRLDMSFGELMNMFEDDDLFISPEYQRAFRWSNFQQTRFIESVLLGIPIPPIFVAEDGQGKWEVVDGLQRISTIFSFFGLLEHTPGKNNLRMCYGEIIKELNGITLDDLPIRLRTTIKRAVCRVEIVRWDSNEDIRYELFNRLNTGSSPLSDQEIRNCIFRSYPVDLNKVLREVAALPSFIELINPSPNRKEEMFLEELVLRFFAFKFFSDDFNTTVPNFLSEFMRSVSRGEQEFDLEREKHLLIELIEFLNSVYGAKLFRPKGNFALHIFDSLSYALPKVFGSVHGNEDAITHKIGALIEDKAYQEIGVLTFSTTRTKNRMDRALEIFQE